MVFYYKDNCETKPRAMLQLFHKSCQSTQIILFWKLINIYFFQSKFWYLTVHTFWFYSRFVVVYRQRILCYYIQYLWFHIIKNSSIWSWNVLHLINYKLLRFTCLTVVLKFYNSEMNYCYTFSVFSFDISLSYFTYLNIIKNIILLIIC